MMIYSGHLVLQQAEALYRSRDPASAFLPGDPLAACDAVRSLIKRDLTRATIDVSSYTVSCGAKIAGTLADLGTVTGPVLGFASTLAGIGLDIFAICRDIKEKNAGNVWMAHPSELTLEVFDDCPILGCYLLTCADTSSGASLFIRSMGREGWMDYVEAIKRTKMDPLLKVATQKITASPLQLEGLKSNKGTFAPPGLLRQEARPVRALAQPQRTLHGAARSARHRVRWIRTEGA